MPLRPSAINGDFPVLLGRNRIFVGGHGRIRGGLWWEYGKPGRGRSFLAGPIIGAYTAATEDSGCYTEQDTP